MSERIEKEDEGDLEREQSLPSFSLQLPKDNAEEEVGYWSDNSEISVSSNMAQAGSPHFERVDAEDVWKEEKEHRKKLRANLLENSRRVQEFLRQKGLDDPSILPIAAFEHLLIDEQVTHIYPTGSPLESTDRAAEEREKPALEAANPLVDSATKQPRLSPSTSSHQLAHVSFTYGSTLITSTPPLSFLETLIYCDNLNPKYNIFPKSKKWKHLSFQVPPHFKTPSSAHTPPPYRPSSSPSDSSPHLSIAEQFSLSAKHQAAMCEGRILKRLCSYLESADIENLKQTCFATFFLLLLYQINSEDIALGDHGRALVEKHNFDYGHLVQTPPELFRMTKTGRKADIRHYLEQAIGGHHPARHPLSLGLDLCVFAHFDEVTLKDIEDWRSYRAEERKGLQVATKGAKRPQHTKELFRADAFLSGIDFFSVIAHEIAQRKGLRKNKLYGAVIHRRFSDCQEQLLLMIMVGTTHSFVLCRHLPCENGPGRGPEPLKPKTHFSLRLHHKVLKQL